MLPVYHNVFKAYLFRGDRKIDEISTDGAPVNPAGSWTKLRRSAQILPLRRQPIPME